MIDPTPYLDRFDSYEQACREFSFRFPPRLNIATEICSRHADAVSRIALDDVKEGGINTYTFGGLDFLSDKFATALTASNITQEDLVAVALPPSAALAITILGVLKAGAVVVPLSIESEPALVERVVANSGAKALVVEETFHHAIEKASGYPLALMSRFVVRDLKPKRANIDSKDFWTEIDRCSSDFRAVETDANSTAFVFYSERENETTGVVHSHRSAVGQLSAFETLNGGDADSVFWSAGDWASASELLGLLLPAWWYGLSAVSTDLNDDMLKSLEECAITNLFIPSVLPKSLTGFGQRFEELANLPVRTIVAEARLAPDAWLAVNSNVMVNEVYSTPESGWTIGKCERLFATPQGSAGRRFPGRLIEIVDNEGRSLPPGCAGHIAVHKTDPGLFTGYWGTAKKRAASFLGDWFLTGDNGYKNEDGNLFISPSPRVVGKDQSEK